MYTQLKKTTPQKVKTVGLDSDEEWEEDEDGGRIEKLKTGSEYKIICYFRKQDDRSSVYCLNRLAAWRSGSDIIHSEFYFVNDKMSLSVDSSNPVYFFEGGQYDPEIWEGYTLYVTKYQYDGVLRYCEEQEDKPFDKTGIFCFDFRKCCSGYEESSWICCRLMAKALIVGGVLPATIDPYVITPARLKELLLEPTIPLCLVKKTS